MTEQTESFREHSDKPSDIKVQKEELMASMRTELIGYCKSRSTNEEEIKNFSNLLAKIKDIDELASIYIQISDFHLAGVPVIEWIRYIAYKFDKSLFNSLNNSPPKDVESLVDYILDKVEVKAPINLQNKIKENFITLIKNGYAFTWIIDMKKDSNYYRFVRIDDIGNPKLSVALIRINDGEIISNSQLIKKESNEKAKEKEAYEIAKQKFIDVLGGLDRINKNLFHAYRRLYDPNIDRFGNMNRDIKGAYNILRQFFTDLSEYKTKYGELNTGFLLTLDLVDNEAEARVLINFINDFRNTDFPFSSDEKAIENMLNKIAAIVGFELEN